MRIPSRTCRARAARSASSTLTPDSLAISMLTLGCRSLSALARAPAQPLRRGRRAPDPLRRGGAPPRGALARPPAHPRGGVRRAPDPLVVALIGIDDVADQPVPHHV